MTTTTGYAVIYRATEDSDEAARNTLDAAEREDVALADVIEVCKSCHAAAELRGANGGLLGWVHPSGDYRYA